MNGGSQDCGREDDVAERCGQVETMGRADPRQNMLREWRERVRDIHKSPRRRARIRYSLGCRICPTQQATVTQRLMSVSRG